MGESRHPIMERSPCLQCDLLYENKNNPTCDACRPVKEYADRIAAGGGSQSLDIGGTDMAISGRERLWTAQEDEFLQNNFMKMKNRELAGELDRTENAVTFRLSKLELRRQKKRRKRSDTPPEKSTPSRPPAEKIPEEVKQILVPELWKDGKPDRPPAGEVPAWSAKKDFMIIDFSSHPELFVKLQTMAAKNYRPPEYQIFYLIDKAANNGTGS